MESTFLPSLALFLSCWCMGALLVAVFYVQNMTQAKPKRVVLHPADICKSRSESVTFDGLASMTLPLFCDAGIDAGVAVREQEQKNCI